MRFASMFLHISEAKFEYLGPKFNNLPVDGNKYVTVQKKFDGAEFDNLSESSHRPTTFTWYSENLVIAAVYSS